jgi:hypothetical protein
MSGRTGNSWVATRQQEEQRSKDKKSKAHLHVAHGRHIKLHKHVQVALFTKHEVSLQKAAKLCSKYDSALCS